MADNLLDSIDSIIKKKATPTASTSTTPLGASLAGVNPDQAKMAGTPNQVASSASKIQAPTEASAVPPVTPKPTTQTGASTPKAPSNFSDFLRTQRPDLAQQTEQEQAQKSKLEREDAIGRLRVSAQDMIAAAQGKSADAITGISQTKSTSDVIQSILTGSDAETISRDTANMTEADKQLVKDGVLKQAPEFGDILEKSLGATRQQLAISLDKFAEDTKVDLNQVAKDLGVADVEALKGLSPEEFISKLQASIDDDVASVRTNYDILGSSSSSPAERSLAARSLVRQGAIGVRTQAEEANALSQDLSKMDDITIAGETYSGIKGLLADKGLSALMTRAMDSNGGEDAELAMHEVERLGLFDPGITQGSDGKWVKDGAEVPVDQVPLVNKYNKTIAALSSAAGTELETIINTQKSAQEVAKVAPNVTLSGEVMQSIIPGWHKGLISESELQTASSFTSAIKTLSPAQATEVATNMNDLAQRGHQDLLVSVMQLKNPDPQLISNQLKFIGQAVKADEVSDKIEELKTKRTSGQQISYADLGTLTKNGFIAQDKLSLYESMGISPEEIMNTVEGNVSSIETYTSLPDSMKPLFSDAFKVKEYIPTAGQVSQAYTSFSTKVDDDGFNPTSQTDLDNLAKLGVSKPEVAALKFQVGNTNTNAAFKKLPPIIPTPAAYGLNIEELDATPINKGADWLSKATTTIASAVQTKLDSIASRLTELEHQTTALIGKNTPYNKDVFLSEQNSLLKEQARLKDPALARARAQELWDVHFSKLEKHYRAQVPH
jgi:hypothetical protein